MQKIKYSTSHHLVCVKVDQAHNCLDFPLQVHDKQALVKRFKTDLHNAAGFIQEPKKLKEHVKELYGKYVSDDTVRVNFFC